MKFPEWTEKYKTKGTYVGKSRNGFFLYKAHCVYDKEKKRGKTVIDEYLGTISETEGFIPKKTKFDTYFSLEYGTSSFILKYFKRDLLKHIYNDNKYAEAMLCASIIYYIYGHVSELAFKNSFLSKIYPKIDFSFITDKRLERTISLSKNINNWLNSLIPDLVDRNNLITLLKNHIILFDGKNYEKVLVNPELKNLLIKYKIEIEV